MLGDIPKRTYKFTTVKDSNSKLFSICAIYTNQEEKNLVSPNTKKKYKGSYSKLFRFYFVRFKKKNLVKFLEKSFHK